MLQDRPGDHRKDGFEQGGQEEQELTPQQQELAEQIRVDLCQTALLTLTLARFPKLIRLAQRMGDGINTIDLLKDVFSKLALAQDDATAISALVSWCIEDEEQPA